MTAAFTGKCFHIPHPFRSASLLLAGVLTLLFSLAIVAVTPATSYAEGSRNINPGGTYRAYLEQDTTTLAGEVRTNEIGVYAKKGEAIYFASSVKAGNLDLTNEMMGTDFSEQELEAINNNSIVVCTPQWDRQKNPHAYPYINGMPDETVLIFRVDQNIDGSWRGYITDYLAEQKGPRVNNNTEGYAPHSLTADVEGIYYFRFYGSDQSEQNAQVAFVGEEERFEENQGSKAVAAWDISVFEGNSYQEGRVFSNKLFLTTGSADSGEEALQSSVYILTKDGYTYQVDFNGLQTTSFLFYSNLRGMLYENDLGYRSLFHSVKSNNSTMSDLADHNVFINATPTEDIDRTHLIFLSAPDAYVYDKYVGSSDITNTELSTAIEGLSFTPAYNPRGGQPATVIGFGGTFSFENDGSLNGSSFQITLDFSTEEDPDNKVILSSALVQGTNSVYWGGLDRYGNVVDAGVYDKGVLFEIKGGEAHFVFLDVENNPNGIKITMLNGASADEGLATVYYNNRNVRTAYASGWTEKNWTVADGIDALSGIDSSQGVSAYTENAGDQVAFDLWTYHSESVILDCPFEVYKGNIDFTLTHTWDTEGDASDLAPGQGTEVNVQLQWRIKNSGEDWVAYDGALEHYHAPILYATNTEYDAHNPLFSGLEQYAGKSPQGKVLFYEYRAIETSLSENYLTDEVSYGIYDLNGVARVMNLTARYSPEKGMVIFFMNWEGDSEAEEVRPESIQLQVFSRELGTDNAWQALSADEGGKVTLEGLLGWTTELILPMHNDQGVKLEYSVMQLSYTMKGKDSVSVLNTQSTDDDAVIPTPVLKNAEGYQIPLYSVNGEQWTSERSGSVDFSQEARFARIEVMSSYTTSLTVALEELENTDLSLFESVTIRVQKDGIDVEELEVELTKEKTSHVFEGLETGHMYTTRIVDWENNSFLREQEMYGDDGYSRHSGKKVRGYFETYVDDANLTSFTVEKKWPTPLGQDPVSVALLISYNDSRADYHESATLSQDDDWVHTFTGLGTGGNITVEEISETSGYQAQYGLITGNDANGYRQLIMNNSDETTITVKKVWEGDDSASSVRPEAIRAELYYREKGSGESWEVYEDLAIPSIELSNLNNWSLDVEVVSSYQGASYEYYVKEIAYKLSGETDFIEIKGGEYAEGYMPVSYRLDGGTVSAKHSQLIDFEKNASAAVELISAYTTSLTAVVSWVNENENDQNNDWSVNIQLHKDDEAVDGQVVELTDESASYTFDDLETGYVYSFVEVGKPESYEDRYTTIEGEDGYSVIGTEEIRGYYQGVTNVAVSTTDETYDSVDSDPEDIMGRIGLSAVVFAGGVVLCFLIVTIRKKMR